MNDSGYELIAQEGKTQTFAIEGAESVEVDLATKKAVLESQTEIDTETLNAALAETNYSVLSV